MALSGNQVGGFGLYGGIGHPRGDYSGKTAQVVVDGLPGGGGKRRKRALHAFGFYKFRKKYLETLKDEQAPALPEPVELPPAQTAQDIKPEIQDAKTEVIDTTPVIKVIEAKQTVSELDELMGKVKLDLLDTEKEVVKMQALKRPRKKKLESKQKKLEILIEKANVISQAKDYTETFIEETMPETSSFEEEQIILMAVGLLLRH